MLVALSVFLRQCESPESKPVATPNSERGRDSGLATPARR
ncbi:DUF6766 family protein [Sphingobium sp. EP60837]